MKLFYAGATATFLEVIRSMGYKDILLSYHFAAKNKNRSIQNIIKLQQEGFNIFLDSGGYSARMHGIPINVNDYADYLAQVSQHVEIAANLDVGDWPVQESNFNLLRTYPNVTCPVLPVYHITEWRDKPWNILEDMMAKYDYVAMGGLAGVAVSDEIKWGFMDFFFSKWNKMREQGRIVKVHGFGITTPEYCYRYPFYSVDSTTWLSGARFGSIYVWNEKTNVLESPHHGKVSSIIKLWEHIPSKYRALQTLCEKYSKGQSVYLNRLAINAYAFDRMRDYCTKLWAARGVTY